MGRNVKHGAESMRGRQGYKVQGSIVTKLLSLDCQHCLEFDSLEKKICDEGEPDFRLTSTATSIFCVVNVETEDSDPNEESKVSLLRSQFQQVAAPSPPPLSVCSRLRWKL